ncbi:MAG: hypothetical protein ACI9P5_004896 [Saprospiraceae bacterium]
MSGNSPFGDISIILNSLMLRHHRGSKNKNIIQNLPFSDDPHFSEWAQGSIFNVAGSSNSYKPAMSVIDTTDSIAEVSEVPPNPTFLPSFFSNFRSMFYV